MEEEEGDIVGRACRQCATYSSTSSNLAALCLHVARMILDLQATLDEYSAPPIQENVGGIDETNSLQHTATGTTGSPGKVKQRISLIGKARVTCGSINLLRILSHETIVHACCLKEDGSADNDLESDTSYILEESFTYRNRDMVDGQTSSQDAAMEIIASTMAFLSSVGCIIQREKHEEILSIPEVYDVITQIFSLLLVLLSTQLYQPMESSAELAAEGRPSNTFFLDKLMQYAIWQRSFCKEEHIRQQQAQSLGHQDMAQTGNLHNEPLLFLYSCLHWMIDRPSPPRRSIASHYVELPNSIAQQMTNMKLSPDGMYESHSIVMASAPCKGEKSESKTHAPMKTSAQLLDASQAKAGDANASTHQGTTSIALGTDDAVDMSSAGHVSGDISSWNTPSNLLAHPIRSILLLSSTFFLLPIRLVRLAFNMIGHSRYRAIMGGGSSYHNMKNIPDGDRLILQQLQAQCEKKSGWSRTNNILWLTDSPLADLGSTLMLILSNNCRSAEHHPFRMELASMNDNRWAQNTTEELSTAANSLFPAPSSMDDHMSMLTLNFESLFEAFGRGVHTELGALTLYTLLLSSPSFAESIAARSDLDTLVMPLLRSLYFSSTMSHVDGQNQPKSGHSSAPALTTNNRPFRSQSQLYVILILLLIFSSDQSFGRDSFRRVHVSRTAAKWYKERHIKDSSLGSMILLVLLRAITFNLNRLHDAFLLSNCCAVLLNLSPHVTDLSSHASHRLVSVTASCFKNYSELVQENGGQPEEEGDLSSSLGMHGEVTRTLLTLIKHSIRRRCLEKNTHLVYALLLEQRDFQHLYSCKCLAKLTEQVHPTFISHSKFISMLFQLVH